MAILIEIVMPTTIAFNLYDTRWGGRNLPQPGDALYLCRQTTHEVTVTQHHAWCKKTDITYNRIHHSYIFWCITQRENTWGKTEGVWSYRWKRMGILGEWCWGWNCQERGNGEGLKEGLWMRRERTWLRLKWRRRIQKIKPNGDGKSTRRRFRCDAHVIRNFSLAQEPLVNDT